VYSAQESFISGTLGSLTQVLTIDGREIGNKNDGWPITEKLSSLYKELIHV
jgi:branched-subunit amino acid aminotransferase/4-amino-4-deoxychorismate lyase